MSHTYVMRLATGHRSSYANARKHSPQSPRLRPNASSARATGGVSSFPGDYPEAIKQAQGAVQRALADGAKLLEVEFPPTSLASVPGDGEGANEMSYSLGFIRQFLRAYQDRAGAVRLLFPDEKEMAMARRGLGAAAPAGVDGAPVFGQTSFQLDFLTQPTGFLDIGLDISRVDVGKKVAPTDELLVAAYPHFDPREMIAVWEMWTNAARERGIPIIVFNGELDRIRSGYYPPLFYPKIGKLAKEFLPNFETAFYIHNFKGTKGGALFRVYPEPWQVLRRDREGLRLVHTQETMPSLKEVALEILPKHP